MDDKKTEQPSKLSKEEQADAQKKKKVLHRTMRTTQILEILLVLAALVVIVVLAIQKLG